MNTLTILFSCYAYTHLTTLRSLDLYCDSYLNVTYFNFPVLRCSPVFLLDNKGTRYISRFGDPVFTVFLLDNEDIRVLFRLE